MELIDKSALVAEIERQISAIDNCPKLTDTQIAVLEGNKVVLTKLLSFLDTLEVKEVDLEKNSLTWEDMLIIHKCIKDAMNKYLYAFQTAEGQQKVYEDVLRRFKEIKNK